MTMIFKGNIFALYNQIGLYDAEDSNSYPTWQTGLELLVFGSKGVAVSVKGDSYIDVKIYTDFSEIGNLIFYGSKQIMVGKEGLTVGSEIAASIAHIDWEEGSTLVYVYGNGNQNESTEIMFVLKL